MGMVRPRRNGLEIGCVRSVEVVRIKNLRYFIVTRVLEDHQGIVDGLVGGNNGYLGDHQEVTQ